MPTLDPTPRMDLDGTRSWPIVQVASGPGRAQVASLRPAAFQPAGAARPLIRAAAQLAGVPAEAAQVATARVQSQAKALQVAAARVQSQAKALQVAAARVQSQAKTLQVAVFGAGAPNTTQTKASDQLFRSPSGENLSPPISQVANEMTETKRQAGPQGRRSSQP